MRLPSVVLVVAACAGATFTVTRAVYSQDGGEKKKDAPAGMPSEADMKAMVEASTTTEEHTKLAAMVGTWDTVMTCGEMKCVGSMTVEPVLGGRMFLSRFAGDMGGMPFEGIELRGFDKVRKDHWSVWGDSMGLFVVSSHGARDKDGNVAQKSDEFEYIGKKSTWHSVMKFVDADHMEADMSMKCGSDPEQKSKMTYVRRKAAASEVK